MFDGLGMQFETQDMVLISFIQIIAKMKDTINPPPREISSGETFDITDWAMA